MQYCASAFSVLCLCISFCVCPVNAQTRKQLPPPVERITDSVVRVGNVLVDTQERTVTCPGAINMDNGPVEYLAVGPKGKLHESLLRLDIRPIHLQVALLLLGLEPRNVLRFQGDPRTPQGPPVELFIRWRDAAGKTQEYRAEDLLMEMPGQRPTSHGPWVFTGSRILKEGFEADLSHSLIAVWHDPAAILDNPRPAGASNAYVVHSRRTPRRGTKIELVIRALSAPAPRGGTS
ncbi:MAG: YdjY domain-containing protein [Chloroherpetonaceae bacterium]|nr:YdjY domain-containing protein [Chthonomonadaceae bacterium]MDW8207624.1 YdjY domain-containing protein [Chloroherpetonaceae bacterium]